MLKRTAAICLTFILVMTLIATGTAHAETPDVSLPLPAAYTVTTEGTSFVIKWGNPELIEELARDPYANNMGAMCYLIDWRVNGGPWHYDREIPAGVDIYEYYPDISLQHAGMLYDYYFNAVLSQATVSKVLAGVPYTMPVDQWLRENSVEFRVRYIYGFEDDDTGELRYSHSPFSQSLSLGTPNPSGDKDPVINLIQYAYSNIPAPPLSISAPEDLTAENMTLNLKWKVPEDMRTLDDIHTSLYATPYVGCSVVDWKLNNGEWQDGIEAYEADIKNFSLIQKLEDLKPNSNGYVSASIEPKALNIPSGVSISSWLADKTCCFRMRYLLEVTDSSGAVTPVLSPYSNTVSTGLGAVSPINEPVDGRAERLWGDDRYKTAATISKEGWEKSDNVVLVDGDNFPDALVGSSFAYLKNAPILITPSNALSSDTRSEIQRLGVKTIYILGNYDSVSKAVEEELKLNYTVVRIGGSGVFDTAVKVGEEVRKIKQFNICAIATQNDFPDALAMAPFSARDTIPILFSEKDKLRSDTKKALQDWGIEHVIIAGGAGVVSSAVENELNDMGIIVERVWGEDRYDTAREVALRFETQMGHQCISIATGRDYPDALTGAVLAAKNNSPIFLVDKDTVNSSVLEYINLQPIEKIYIFGGSGVVSDSAISRIGK